MGGPLNATEEGTDEEALLFLGGIAMEGGWGGLESELLESVLCLIT